MSQTAYGLLQTPIPGVRGEISHSDLVMSGQNQDGTWNIPFGVMTARKGISSVDSLQQLLKMPSSASDEMLGISLLAHVYDPGPLGTLNMTGTVGTAPGPGVLQNQQLSVLRKGQCWVVCETDAAVNAGAKCFVRFAQNGAGKLQLGAFRANADLGAATANVQTVTPTAVNATIYVLRVEVADANGVLHAFEFEALSSGAATAATIVTQFKGLMAADAAFSALVTASGTTTLILTAAAATNGAQMVVQSEGDGAMAVANTTPGVPAAANAVAVKARFLSSSKQVPATTPYPGQSLGAQSPAFPSAGVTVQTALVEFDGSVF